MYTKEFSVDIKYRVRELIREECCNYYSGNCDCLDDGEPHTCPQMITNHLCCMWFIKAVLPLSRQLNDSIHDLRKKGTITCAMCGKSIIKQSNSMKYCKACASNVTRRKKIDHMTKKRTINVEK